MKLSTRWPNTLYITLKRLQYNKVKKRSEKSTRKVKVPIKLNLFSDDDEYILYSLQKHTESTDREGNEWAHYVSEVMDQLTGNWFEFDDDIVQHIKKPSFTYDPKKDLKRDGTVNLGGGSKTIKSCFYVKKSFLKKQVLKRLEMLKNGVFDNIDKVDMLKNVDYDNIDKVEMLKNGDYDNMVNCNLEVGFKRLVFPFEANNHKLFVASKELKEASQLFFDDSERQQHLYQQRNEKKLPQEELSAHTTIIDDKELKILKKPDAYLNDTLIDFWMLW